jgi:hypothetical protein
MRTRSTPVEASEASPGGTVCRALARSSPGPWNEVPVYKYAVAMRLRDDSISGVESRTPTVDVVPTHGPGSDVASWRGPFWLDRIFRLAGWRVYYVAIDLGTKGATPPIRESIDG